MNRFKWFLIFIRRFDKGKQSVLGYCAFCLSVTNVKAYYSESNQDIAIELLEYVVPYQHFG